MTKGQPYPACAAPDREAIQQDCSLIPVYQVGRESAKKYEYQHRPPLEGVIESNPWETVVGGGTTECAKTLRHLVAFRKLEHHINPSKQD